MDGYLLQNGFTKSPSEPSLYIKTQGSHDFLILCLYVDDLIYMGTNPRMLEDFKKAMMSKYEMTDLGAMKYFLGMQVKQSSGRIFLSQEKYAEDMLKKLNMSDCKPMATNEKLSKYDGKDKVDASMYRNLVGSLIYLTNTRPDIVHAVSIVSKFMNEPSTSYSSKNHSQVYQRHKELWNLVRGRRRLQAHRIYRQRPGRMHRR